MSEQWEVWANGSCVSETWHSNIAQNVAQEIANATGKTVEVKRNGEHFSWVEPE